MNSPTSTHSHVEPKIEESWKQILAPEFQKDYFAGLKQFLVEEKKQHTIYPPGSQIFAAFQNTPFSKVKVVILGQDPYHGPGQANGLCFSVAPGVRQPPSLQNIFKEIEQDLGIPIPSTGDLSPWTEQGVLLLNATLTVRARSAGSHQNQGWEPFTDAIIQLLSQEREGLVFLLWGKFARSKTAFIDTQKHHVLEAPHPSPFSAHSGFFGCKHFSKTNEILKSRGEDPIQWGLDKE
jgi:uracil-DNA glycosylase